MAKKHSVDRNKLEVGQTVAWLNNGWVEGVIHTVVKGDKKIMYLVKPGYGLEEFGGASFTTGWKQSIIGADCLVALSAGGDEKELTPPNLEYAYGDSALYHKGELKKMPEVVPQDRNMFAEWRKQGRSDKVCVESPDEQKERLAREAGLEPVTETAVESTPAPVQAELLPTQRTRTRTRTRPT